jgi:hypothetical protein
MNQNPSSNTPTSSSSGASAESISRRAYELWEQEGRPDGNDLRHWLQAEHELSGTSSASTAGGYTDTPQSRPSTDSRPLQGTRSTPPSPARDTNAKQRSSNAPFAAGKSGSNGGTATLAGARRRN